MRKTFMARNAQQKRSTKDYNPSMEKICIISVALLMGAMTVGVARIFGVTPSDSVILGFLIALYGCWVGAQVFIKVQHTRFYQWIKNHHQHSV